MFAGPMICEKRQELIVLCRGRPSFAFSLFMLSAVFLFTCPTYAQQKTHFSLGFNTGYIFANDRDMEDWGPLVGPHIQLQQGHWALRAEIDSVPKWTFFMPFVDLVYNLRPSEECKFSPYVSIGIGGRGVIGEYFGILSRIRIGILHRIIRVREGAFVLNAGLASIHDFPFYPGWLSLNLGLEFVFR
ncbi:MAG: hypothetical protein A2V45_10620 [Candidatus Aminicenantes bacterium RBG_19FT_COMBO_58_17]|nr:MAG: hypothetical protein A2V45_10620 [Candidatus Aminicenantes bacterium RBG_19FT_COMBO_58_17]HCS46779.1 hypothetical protein [Candidatus Aminicenantes bacterium]